MRLSALSGKEHVLTLTLPAGISQKTIFSNKLCIETKR